MGDIAVRGVSVAHGGTPVLSGVDLRIRSGERLALLGPSGSGKTSLLRVMAGLDRPAEGSVEIDGRPVERRSEEITMVFQGGSIYEHLDVGGNLAFPSGGGDDPDDLERRVEEAARRFLLTRVLDRSPGTLSVGQRRMVAAARAMVRSNVSVVLLDDPLVGADQRLRRRMVEAILSDPDLTVVFATQEGNDTLRWGDRVAVLADGGLAQIGPPTELFRHPVSLTVAEAMGELNRFPATVSLPEGRLEVAGSRLAPATLPSGIDHGRRVVIGVRPSGLHMAGAGTPFNRRLRGIVGRIETVGAIQRVLFGLGEQGVGFCAAIDATLRLDVGDRVDWALEPDDIRIYDPVSGAAL